MPSASKYVRKNGAVEYMLSTRGMPMRIVLRRFQASSLERWNGRVIVSRLHAEERLRDLDVFDRRAGGGHRRPLVEVHERALAS